MNAPSGEKDHWDDLQEELNKDGTHPESPVRKSFHQEDWGQLPWSDLAFDLPALVVYGQREESSKPAVGLVIALSHQLGRTRILVRSKYNGQIILHPIEESPWGLKPSYLLLKKHLPMTGLP